MGARLLARRAAPVLLHAAFNALASLPIVLGAFAGV
jgi:hypothetical protein